MIANGQHHLVLGGSRFHNDGRGPVQQGVLDEVGDDLFEPPAVGEDREVVCDAQLDGCSVGYRRQRQFDGHAQFDGPHVQDDRPGLEAADVEQVVGQARDPLRLSPDGLAHALDAVGAQLVAVRLEGRAQAQDGGEGIAQVMRDEGEELVLRLLEVALRGDVAHDALEPGGHAPFPTGAGRHLQHPAHTVGPAHCQFGAIPLVGVDREALEHVGPLEGCQHI